MENLKPHHWMTVVFFSGCSLFIAYCVYYLASLPSVPHSDPPETASIATQQANASGEYVLVKGKADAMDNLKLRYVGLEDDIILIDVTIVDLDPEYAYRHRISRKSAQDGFQVGGVNFKLLSVNDLVLILKPCQG